MRLGPLLMDQADSSIWPVAGMAIAAVAGASAAQGIAVQPQRECRAC
jgi:hypothetical protein